jgi:uncharacterized membrane protein
MQAVRVLFLPGDRVNLVAIGAAGTVVSVRLTTGMNWYSVDYWWEGVLRNAEVMAPELAPQRSPDGP